MEHLHYAGNKLALVVQLLSFRRQGVNNAMSTNAWPKITTVTIIILTLMMLLMMMMIMVITFISITTLFAPVSPFSETFLDPYSALY